MTDKRVEPIQADDIFQLADAINEFSKTHDIFSTQLIDRKESILCLIWYNTNKPENIFKKEVEELATEKQLWALKRMRIGITEGLTKAEASLIIKREKEESEEEFENEFKKEETKNTYGNPIKIKDSNRNKPASDAQRKLMNSLGISIPPNLLMGEAFEIIAEHKKRNQ